MSANRRSLVGPGGTSSAGCAGAFAGAAVSHTARSEEHTSELQSRFDLVCGLLLEKKRDAVKDAVSGRRPASAAWLNLRVLAPPPKVATRHKSTVLCSLEAWSLPSLCCAYL